MAENSSIDRPFGAENRQRLLAEYFEGRSQVSPSEAWRDVYRLLMWIDRTTGLAHCYESDKAQPGRPWYARTLAFHNWLAAEFETAPRELRDELDWLFGRVTSDLLSVLVKERQQQLEEAADQRDEYEHPLPTPGDDPGLASLIERTIEPWLEREIPDDVLTELGEEIRFYFTMENKRKNLLGEGFEDTLAFLIDRLPGRDSRETLTREMLHHVPGFAPPRRSEKTRTVDIAVVLGDGKAPSSRRVLVTSKWSVRADREEQFAIDFNDYARLEQWGQDFDYVLVTNEFDPARLVAACERRTTNASLFSDVVHVNPDGLRAAYSRRTTRPWKSADKILAYIESGRLIGLGRWLDKLVWR